MAYLFLGTKATKASNYNDVIRIYNKKVAAEMNVDEKYSYQLYITFGLWQQEQSLEGFDTIAAEELEELTKIKNDIIRLYEEIYGKHVEKHKIIKTYQEYIAEAIDAIRQMCQEIDKDLLDKIEDLSEEFQRRINEIKAKLAAIVSKHIDPAKLSMETAIENLVEKVSHFTNYDAETYQRFIDAMLSKLDKYLDSTEETEEILKQSFTDSVDKLIQFDAFGPFVLDEEKDAELYEACKNDIEEYVAEIKAQAEEIKKFTFKDDEEKDYSYNGEDDYEHKGENYDIDGDGNVFIYGETEPVTATDAQNAPVQTSDDVAKKVLGEEKVEELKQKVLDEKEY